MEGPVGVLGGALLAVALAPGPARGQTWIVDVYAGRATYEAVTASVGGSNVVGNVRLATPDGTWAYGAAAAPLGEDAPPWAALGAGRRVTLLGGAAGGRPELGVELGGQVYAFNDRVVAANGLGAVLEALSFVGLGSGPARAELSGGWRHHVLGFADDTESRGVAELGARLSYATPVSLQVDLRYVRAPEGGYPQAGARVAHRIGPAGLWVRVDRWLGKSLRETGWEAGSSLAVGDRWDVWSAVREETRDPLYWNLPRRSWSAGVTWHVGPAHASGRPLATPRTVNGEVEIRLGRGDVPRGGAPQVAGDFNGWTPQSMLRDGGDWIFRAPLRSGVYRYAFRVEGEWFVPESFAGRREDDMGGHVAVLVVP